MKRIIGSLLLVFVIIFFTPLDKTINAQTPNPSEILIGSGTETQPAQSEDGSTINIQNTLIPGHLYRFDVANNNFNGFWVAVCQIVSGSWTCAGNQYLSSPDVSMDSGGNIGYPYTTNNTASLPQSFSVFFTYPSIWSSTNYFGLFKRCWIDNNCSMNWALYDITSAPSTPGPTAAANLVYSHTEKMTGTVGNSLVLDDVINGIDGHYYSWRGTFENNFDGGAHFVFWDVGYWDPGGNGYLENNWSQALTYSGNRIIRVYLGPNVSLSGFEIWDLGTAPTSTPTPTPVPTPTPTPLPTLEPVLLGSGTEIQLKNSEGGSILKFINQLIPGHLYRFNFSHNNFDGFWMGICQWFGGWAECAHSDNIFSGQVAIDGGGNLGYPYTTHDTAPLPENFSVSFRYPFNWSSTDNTFGVYKRCWINNTCSMDWALYDLSWSSLPTPTPQVSNHCTYESTTTGNHVDFRITSDTDKLIYITAGTHRLGLLSNPTAPYSSWVNLSEENNTCSINTPDAGISCQLGQYQIYWHNVSNYGSVYGIIPNGIYGFDINGGSDFWLMYATLDGSGSPWDACVRTGEISDWTNPQIGLPPSPTSTPNPTATPLPTPTDPPVTAPVNISVNDLGDNTQAGDGKCTLREAILNASNKSDISAGDCVAGSGDGYNNITFSADGVISVSSYLPDPGTINLTIDGLNKNIALDGNNLTRIFNLLTPSTVLKLKNLNIKNGRGGVIYNEGTLSIDRTTIENNISVDHGGGIINKGTLNINESTLTYNFSPEGGAVLNFGKLYVTNSTFSNNHGDGGGAAISSPGELEIYNSTFYANNSGGGGTVGYRGSKNAVITNSTFSDNTGVGIANDGPLTLSNTVLIHTTDFYELNCRGDGKLTNGGGNLRWPLTDKSCVGVYANPLLIPLADNGGPTKTMALQSNSPAIDIADDTVCSTYPINNHDQRGFVRPSGRHCDAGAYEYPSNSNPSIEQINIITLIPTIINTAVNVEAAFTDPDISDTHTASWNWGDGSITIGEITELGGSGTVVGSHSYSLSGVYTLTLTLQDSQAGSVVQEYKYLVIYDPTTGFVTGGGQIMSNVGAYVLDPFVSSLALFGFSAKYNSFDPVPSGQVGYSLTSGNLAFVSTSLNWLVIIGNTAYINGTGTINGVGNYPFYLSVTDDSQDKLRIRILGESNELVYDNGAGNPITDPPLGAIYRGQIKIH